MQPEAAWIPTWIRSPECSNGTCVEVAELQGGVGLRDSKEPAAGMLRFTVQEWSAFVAGVKSGAFDFGG